MHRQQDRERGCQHSCHQDHQRGVLVKRHAHAVLSVPRDTVRLRPACANPP